MRGMPGKQPASSMEDIDVPVDMSALTDEEDEEARVSVLDELEQQVAAALARRLAGRAPKAPEAPAEDPMAIPPELAEELERQLAASG